MAGPAAGDAPGDVPCHTDFCNTGPASSGCVAVGSTTTTVNVTLRMAGVDPVAIVSNASRAALEQSVGHVTFSNKVSIVIILDIDLNLPLWPTTTSDRVTIDAQSAMGSRVLAATANVRVLTSVAFDHPSAAVTLAAANATLGSAIMTALTAPDAPPAAAAFAGAVVTTEAVVVGAPVPAPSASPFARAGARDSGNEAHHHHDDAKKRTTTGIIVGVVIGGSVLLAAIAALVVVMVRRRRGAASVGEPSATAADVVTAVAPKQAAGAEDADSEARGPAPPVHSNYMPGAHHPRAI